MLNKTIRSTIIVTFQTLVPAILLFFIAPQVLKQTHLLNQAQYFLNNHRLQLLLIHSCFYMALFWCWPIVINLMNNTTDKNTLKIATSARWYLITAMAFFELLINWK